MVANHKGAGDWADAGAWVASSEAAIASVAERPVNSVVSFIILTSFSLGILSGLG